MFLYGNFPLYLPIVNCKRSRLLKCIRVHKGTQAGTIVHRSTPISFPVTHWINPWPIHHVQANHWDVWMENRPTVKSALYEKRDFNQLDWRPVAKVKRIMRRPLARRGIAKLIMTGAKRKPPSRFASHIESLFGWKRYFMRTFEHHAS